MIMREAANGVRRIRYFCDLFTVPFAVVIFVDPAGLYRL
jgi:hypothetical protein